MLDAATARAGGWRVGDPLGIVGADGAPRRFRVVGVTGFAGAQSPASELDTFDTPTVALLTTAAAQRLLGRGDAVDEVWVRAASGVGPDTLRDRIARLLPAGRLEAVTASTLPTGQLLVDLALAGSAGLVAAAVPAHRAARLDLLTAVGAE